MSYQSRRVVEQIAERWFNDKFNLRHVKGIELTLGENDLDDVPGRFSIHYFLEQDTNVHVSGFVGIRGRFFDAGRKRAKEVVTEVWAYYTSRGIPTRVVDNL